MRPYKLILGAAVLVTAVTVAACDDIPFLPQWDADIYVPFGGQNLNGVQPGVIPANSSANVPGDTTAVSLDGTAGDVLDRSMDETSPVIRLELRINKTANLAVSLSDTIYLAGTRANLQTTQVKMGFVMAANQTFVVDTLQLDATGVQLIRQLVDAGDSLYLQPRGRVTSGNSTITVTSSDSIHVKIGALVRVPVAGGK